MVSGTYVNDIMATFCGLVFAELSSSSSKHSLPCSAWVALSLESPPHTFLPGKLQEQQHQETVPNCPNQSLGTVPSPLLTPAPS